MVRPIVKDIFFLGQKSEIATTADKQVAIDLLDTLKANKKYCVGMAANMIGVKKRIIIVNIGITDIIMFNPNIISKKSLYEMFTPSLLGIVVTQRCRTINERKELPMSKMIHIWEKSNLTLEEVVAYSGIGINKLREIRMMRNASSYCG